MKFEKLELHLTPEQLKEIDRIEKAYINGTLDQGGAEMNYTIRQMDVFREDKKIYGEFYIPEKGSFPLVICCHGLGGIHEGSRDIAERFASEGIGAFIFDFCGGSYDSLSEGKTTEMTVLTETKDLEVIIDELKKHEGVDVNNIFLLGKSQGAVVSTIVAFRRPDEIKGIIGLYSGYFMEDMAREEAGKYEKLPPVLNVLKVDVSDRYIEDMMNLHIYDMMRKYSGDVLLIHGTEDSVAPISYAEEAAVTFPNARLITIEGAEHGFHGPEREDVVEASLKFVKKHLNS